jgi:hypothetical protein
MSSKRVNPATQAACRARKSDCLAAVVSEDKSTTPNLQDHRAQWLVRRFRLPLSMAAAVAGLAFPQREAAR